jgi:hypothetical protein
MAARAGTASLTLVRGGLTAFTRNGSLASLGGKSGPPFGGMAALAGRASLTLVKGRVHVAHAGRAPALGRAQRAIRSGERVRAARPGEQSKPATPRERSERAVPRRSRAVRNGRPRGNGFAHAREGPRSRCSRRHSSLLSRRASAARDPFRRAGASRPSRASAASAAVPRERSERARSAAKPRRSKRPPARERLRSRS